MNGRKTKLFYQILVKIRKVLKRVNNTYISLLGAFYYIGNKNGIYMNKISGFDSSEYGIERMRFEKGGRISDIIKKIPHIAFEADSLDEAIKGKELLVKAVSTSKGVKVAMILDNGSQLEFPEFEKNK